MKQERPIAITASRRSDTIYIVEYATSDSAKESALDKVEKLILHDAENLKKYKAS